MTCPTVVRVKMRPISPSRFQNLRQDLSFRRTFFSIPGSEVITLTESRVLPYKSTSLYAMISDVDRYASFLPYCQESRVTKWSAPDNKGKKWPEEADLKVGWGGYEETFTSKLYCVPDSIVEALGGDAVTTIPKQQLQHRSSSINSPAPSNNIFKRLSTRWTVKPFHRETPSGNAPTVRPVQHGLPHLTDVRLTVEFQFSNPVYGALSKAVAPKLAQVMIEAFEKRAKMLLGSSEDTGSHGNPGKRSLDKVFGR